jgi:hypothetical protein
MMGQMEEALDVEMMAASPFYTDRNRSSMGSGNYFYIFNQNIRGLRTRFIETLVTIFM